MMDPTTDKQAERPKDLHELCKCKKSVSEKVCTLSLSCLDTDLMNRC